STSPEDTEHGLDEKIKENPSGLSKKSRVRGDQNDGKESIMPDEVYAATCAPAIDLELLEVDSREHPLTAPAGTPVFLKDAFEAVARALFHAARMLLEPPECPIQLAREARQLVDASRKALEYYSRAERPLQAAANEAVGCAHQNAINAIARVVD